MHITNQVDLPEKLIQAQREGKLVIFAGAGVSKGPPANLPLYWEILDEIGKGAGIPREGEYEPLECYAQRIEEAGIPLRKRIVERISDKSSKPTQLHEALLSLFPSGSEIRLITTNWDLHFSTAARWVFPKQKIQECSSLMPTSARFHGIWYIHGRIDERTEDLVVTKHDFNRLYSGDGHVMDLLRSIYFTSSVVFVGYGLNDPPILSLTDGLKEYSLPFWAFARTGTEKDWEKKGVTPISYPLPDEVEHTELIQAVVNWARLNAQKQKFALGVTVEDSTTDYIKCERRIRNIASIDNLVTENDVNFIDSIMSDSSKVRLFVRHVSSPDWICKIEKLGKLDTLFSEKNTKDTIALYLANWLAERFVWEYPEKIFALIARQRKNPSHLLWESIGWALSRRNNGKDLFPLEFWVTFLLKTRKPEWDLAPIESILRTLDSTVDLGLATDIFRCLVVPRWPSEKLDSVPYLSEIRLLGDSYTLSEVWNSFLVKHIDQICKKLEPYITAVFSQLSLGLSATILSTLSFRRPTIENCEDTGHLLEGQDVLIDSARDIVEALLKTDTIRALRLINLWANSDILLLKRLAIHGILESSLSPDSKITWILEKDWLYLLGVKHEVFRLLATAWPKASIEVKNTLLDTIDIGPSNEHAKNLDQSTIDYERYNVYVWLDRTNPNDPLLTKQLRRVQETFPSFEPRTYPDLDIEPIITEWIKPLSPFTENQLVEKAPSEIVDSLVEYPEEGFHTPDQEGFLSELTKTASHSFDSAIKLAKELIERNDWESPIWKALFKGWSEADLSSEQWTEMLWLLTGHKQLLQYTFDVADMLLKSTEKESDLTTSNLESIEALSDALFMMAESERSGISQGDWFLLALNHTCGKVAQIWLNALNSRKRLNQSNWDGLPSDYIKRFSTILDRKSLGSGIVIAILMRKLDYFAGLDMSWVQSILLPLLNWTKTNEYAEYAWHGYLYGKGIPLDFEKELVPCYKSVFEKLETQLDNIRGQFCDHLAILALYASTNPISKENGWLQDFVQAANVEARIDFAQAIDRRLSVIDESKRKVIWDSWLKKYWHQRNNDSPTPLAQEEKRVMIHWTFALDFAFEQAVDEICYSSAPDWAPHHNDLYYELNNGLLPTNQPKPTARLVAHLLKSATELYDFRPFESLVQTLNENGASYEDLYEICNQLCRLGYPKALELADSLKGPEAT